jgi:hypothetical protein
MKVLARAIGLDAVNVENEAGDAELVGKWKRLPKTAARLRVMPFWSEHAPHFMHVKLFGGERDPRDKAKPEDAYDWREGQTLAFLVDVLSDDGQPVLRLYYQDAATNAPIGSIPKALLEERRVDVAFLCAASFEEVKDHPRAIVAALAPRFVIAGHWEDFFRDPRKPLRPVPFLNLGKFEKRLAKALEDPNGDAYAILVPGDVLDFGTCR